MKRYKLWIYIIAAAAITFLGIHDVVARGGGGRGGGGWSGGRGGGGEFSRPSAPGGGGRGQERSFEHGDRIPPDHRPINPPDHRPNWNPPDRNATVTKNVNVNVPDNGWYGYGAADEALAGMMMVTAMGAVAARPAEGDTTVIVEQPAAPAAQAPQQPAIPSIGAQVAALPQGCQARNVDGTLYYQSGAAWYRPYFGASGVYYQVVQPPSSVGGSAT